MCREKQKVTKGVYRRSHVRQELRSCVRSRISPAINGVQSAVVLHGFAFVVYFCVCVVFFLDEPSGTGPEFPAVDLSVPQANRLLQYRNQRTSC